MTVPNGQVIFEFVCAVLGRLAESIDTLVSRVVANGDADFPLGVLHFLALFVAGACAENQSSCSQLYRKIHQTHLFDSETNL